MFSLPVRPGSDRWRRIRGPVKPRVRLGPGPGEAKSSRMSIRAILGF